MMQTCILDIIAQIQKAKRMDGKEPSYALLSEIASRCSHDPRQELSELYRTGRIRYHRTINQPAFYIP